MFFSASKLFWFFFAPSHLILWLLVAAVVLLAFRRERIALWCASISAALLLGFGMLPFSVWLMHPLENQFPRRPMPAHIDGIVVLGGGLDGDIFASRGTIGSNDSAGRLVSAFILARNHPEARVVFTGGATFAGDQTEAATARALFTQLGLDPRRLIEEDRARDTWENLVFSKRLASVQPGEVWVLATSAYHLRRATGIAARIGWKMIPYPTDYMTARNGYYDYRQVPDNLRRADAAAHEWVGLIAYRLSRRSGQ